MGLKPILGCLYCGLPGRINDREASNFNPKSLWKVIHRLLGLTTNGFFNLKSQNVTSNLGGTRKSNNSSDTDPLTTRLMLIHRVGFLDLSVNG